MAIHNGFMSPFDREYGRSLGNFLAAEPFVTYPMGGVENPILRDRLHALRPESTDLREIVAEFGMTYWDPAKADQHVAYLRQLFGRLRAGVRKSPLPRWLHWIKAPGSHLYYWSDLPRYRIDDGPLAGIEIRRKEIYFCISRYEWLVLRDDLLVEMEMKGSASGNVR
ncbi:hypothetical protein GXW82_10570 [Streptacidiphilus sp. 4-A2]|nr:hypothetical protein [Streptacidiphilus sp. 4-A2]